MSNPADQPGSDPSPRENAPERGDPSHDTNSGHNGNHRRSQRERREASRHAILAAARAEFIERGYAHVSLEDIVSRAGLTRGALYHQFDDKSCVLEAVVHEEAAIMQQRMAPFLAGIEKPLDRLIHALSVYLDHIEDLRILRLIHVDYPAHCGPARSTLGSAWLNYVETLINEASNKGLIRRANPRALARLYLAITREALIAIAYADDPVATRREMTTALLAFFEGLRVQPPAGDRSPPRSP